VSEPRISSDPPAQQALARESAIAEIGKLLLRTRDTRLQLVRQFLHSPSGRVFFPRSSQGPGLFARIVDLDVSYARVEQKLVRIPDPLDAYAKRARLERDICDVHVLLIELCAELANSYGLEPQDPAVIRALERRRSAAKDDAGQLRREDDSAQRNAGSAQGARLIDERC